MAKRKEPKTAKPEAKTFQVGRDAKTGRFISVKEAQRRKRTAVVETFTKKQPAFSPMRDTECSRVDRRQPCPRGKPRQPFVGLRYARWTVMMLSPSILGGYE